jgi:acyl-CoA reductase-like NAD-dependent aldehyde dehydrogenase
VSKIPICSAPLSPEFKLKTGCLGPIVSAKQYASVMAHIDGAVKEGAKVLAGGKRPPNLRKG